MFKKIEIWILYLALFISVPFAIFFGVLVRQEIEGNIKFGKLSQGALFLAEIPKNLKLMFKNSLVVIDRFHDLNGFNGTPNNYESYMLLSRYDGNSRESVVELVDLRNFDVLHTWNPNINQSNDFVKEIYEFKYLSRDHNDSRARIWHPILMKDGGLIFNNAESPLRKIDKCSNLIFQKYNDQFHHSLEKDSEGNIWANSYMYPQTLPVEKVGRKLKPDGGYLDDGIVHLTPNGNILFEKSVSQIFIENEMEYLLFSIGGSYERDPIHINDIQPANFNTDFWNKGDLFLSLRHQSMVLLYRPSTNKIIWKGTGPFFHQHDVDIIDNHRIAIFNNNSKNFLKGNVVETSNEVLIYDFKLDKYSAYLPRSLSSNSVRTVSEGRSEILSNGDLLIEETNFGRTLYFNSDGSLRWTHLNRSKNGNVYVVNWSRILANKEDIINVKTFLNSQVDCYD